ncbi:MAG: cytochrome b5-like heme/steroid binding domain-containing protein [Candidatus Paceibacterota bacterium]|jgi:cytochrome b involved in lipid metabolism
MQNYIVSIIIGALLVLGVGTSVYKTQSPIVPPQDALVVENTATDNSGTNTTLKDDDEFENEDEDDDDGSPVAQPTTQPKPKTQSGGITLSEVAKHNSRSSCWSAINNNVYDLTSWIPNHPGGEQRILSLCGVDGSAAYNGQHSGNSKPATMLAGFKLGALSN